MKDRIRQKLEANGYELVSKPADRPNGFGKGWDAPENQEAALERAEAKQAEQDKKQVTSFSYEQMQRMMQEMMAANSQAMVEAIRELKKPSEEEAAKLAEAKLRRERLMESMLESARVERAERDRMQEACSHKKPNGIINFGGQVHGDRVRLICKTCFKELVNRKATPEDIQMGPLELMVENQRMGMAV